MNVAPGDTKHWERRWGGGPPKALSIISKWNYERIKVFLYK